MAEKKHGIDWSSLWRKEDWWPCWIGWFILLLAIAGMLPKAPRIATWTALSKALPDGWGTLGTLIVLFITTAILTGIGAAVMKRDMKRYFPGFLVIFIIAFIAMVIAGKKGIKYYGFEYVLWALFIGLLISNVFGVPAWLKPSVMTEFFIKIGLAVMGATINFVLVIKAGAVGMIQAVVVVAAVWFFGYWLSRRMGINQRFSSVIATGVSFCGVSASIAAGGAVQVDPQYIDAYRNRGSLFQQQQDYDQAIADLSKAIRLSSNDLSSYFITIDRGNAYMMKEDFDKAIADYSEAIRVKSDYFYAYDRRGLAYFVKGDYNRALADYSKVITNDPKSAYVYLAQVRKGDIYRARLNHERALDEYTQAARSNSERMEAYYGRGSVYYSRGDYDRATADYSEAIKIAPQFEHSYVHLVNVSRKLSAEDYQVSLKKLRDYVNNSSSAEWIRTASKYYLGVADITEEGVLNDAKKGKNALVRRINLCEAYYFLGEVRLGKGDRIGARKLFNKSVETKSYLSGEFHISQALLKRMAEGKY